LLATVRYTYHETSFKRHINTLKDIAQLKFLCLFGTAVKATTMINRIRQYPRVKQSEDRAFSPSPANRLLYILLSIRELYNTSSDGQSANNIRDFGYNQLLAFLHHSLDMSEEDISQHLPLRYKSPGSSQLNCLSDFVRWGTSRVWEWADNSNARIFIALEAFKRVDRLCLESVEWQKTVEEDPYMRELEAKRFSTLLGLLRLPRRSGETPRCGQQLPPFARFPRDRDARRRNGHDARAVPPLCRRSVGLV
jgi:hypothetical protein